jgi:hypothetical protein
VKKVRKALPPHHKESKDGVLLAMLLKHGLRRGDITYLAALREVKEETYVDVLKQVQELLEEFRDVMPPKLPRTLLLNMLWIIKLSYCLVLYCNDL